MTTDHERHEEGENAERAAARIFEEWQLVAEKRSGDGPLTAAEATAYCEGLLKSLEILADECDVDPRTEAHDRDVCDECGAELVQMLGGARCPRCG